MRDTYYRDSNTMLGLGLFLLALALILAVVFFYNRNRDESAVTNYQLPAPQAVQMEPPPTVIERTEIQQVPVTIEKPVVIEKPVIKEVPVPMPTAPAPRTPKTNEPTTNTNGTP